VPLTALSGAFGKFWAPVNPTGKCYGNSVVAVAMNRAENRPVIRLKKADREKARPAVRAAAP
jgi:membrane carboxypeptidase/penicillin-binding protein